MMCDAICFYKILNLSRWKEGPLSDTRVTDRMSNAKMVLNLSVVCEAEVELTTKTLGHLEKASATTNNNHFYHWS